MTTHWETEALALRSVLRLLRIELAEVKKDLWYERYNHASVMLTAARKTLVEAENDSRTNSGPIEGPVPLQYKNEIERMVIDFADVYGWEAKPHPEDHGWWLYRDPGAETWMKSILPQAILAMADI